jgi:PAS domain S-box-containing protein|nr:ATP-binding protein [Heyndrickxia oleronia]
MPNAYNCEQKVNKKPICENNVIARLKLNGVYTFISSISESIIGFTPKEMIGKSCFEFIIDPDRIDIREKFTQLKHDIDTVKYRMMHKDGHLIWLETTLSIVRDKNDQPVEILSISKDITCEKKMLDYIEQTEKLSLTGELVAGIAHEIKNSLTSVKGFLQLMKTGIIHNNQYFNVIKNEINRIEIISKELMLLGKPMKRKYQLHHLHELINSSIILLEPETNRHNIEIHTFYPKKPIEINCNEAKIKQLFINIIKNAIESMKNGGKLIVRIEERKKQYVNIYISDEGCGISKEMLHKIGTPFFTTKKSGNGLGLMICKNIIEEHTGSLTVESVLNKGTTFIIRLPIG